MAKFRYVAKDMGGKTYRGTTEAMESKQCFPDLMIGMLRSGEGSGNLDQVTDRLAMQYEKEYKLTQQVRSAMTYPCILLVLCVAIAILIVTFILPQFQSLFDQMDSLPWVTTVLIAASDFLTKKWYLAILNLVREGKTHQIGSIMQTSGNAAMHTLNMDLSRLVKQGYISRENALAYTNNKAEIQQYL